MCHVVQQGKEDAHNHLHDTAQPSPGAAAMAAALMKASVGSAKAPAFAG